MTERTLSYDQLVFSKTVVSGEVYDKKGPGTPVVGGECRDMSRFQWVFSMNAGTKYHWLANYSSTLPKDRLDELKLFSLKVVDNGRAGATGELAQEAYSLVFGDIPYMPPDISVNESIAAEAANFVNRRWPEVANIHALWIIHMNEKGLLADEEGKRVSIREAGNRIPSLPNIQKLYGKLSSRVEKFVLADDLGFRQAEGGFVRMDFSNPDDPKMRDFDDYVHGILFCGADPYEFYPHLKEKKSGDLAPNDIRAKEAIELIMKAKQDAGHLIGGRVFQNEGNMIRAYFNPDYPIKGLLPGLREKVREILEQNVDYPGPEDEREEFYATLTRKITYEKVCEWLRDHEKMYARFGLRPDSISIEASDESSQIQNEALEKIASYKKDWLDRNTNKKILDDDQFWKLLAEAAEAGCAVVLEDIKTLKGDIPEKMYKSDRRTLAVNMEQLFLLFANKIKKGVISIPGNEEAGGGGEYDIFRIMNHPLAKAFKTRIIYLSGAKYGNGDYSTAIKTFDLCEVEPEYEGEKRWRSVVRKVMPDLKHYNDKMLVGNLQGF